MIGIRLVDEAPSVLVDRDQARLGAVEQDVRIDSVFVQRAREIECRIGVLGVNDRAHSARRRKSIAARARERIRMCDRQYLHEFRAQLFILGEAAGRQDHAASRADCLALVADIDHRAFHSIVALHEPDESRVERDRHGLYLQAVEQPRHQRIAHDQPCAARIAQAVGRVTQQQLRGRRESAPRRERVEQNRDVIFPDHHAAKHHEGCDGRPHAAEIRAEQSSVERQRRERAAGERAARLVRMIVGMARRRAEFHLRARFEIVECPRARCEKGLAHGFGAGTDFRLQKAPRIVD